MNIRVRPIIYISFWFLCFGYGQGNNSKKTEKLDAYFLKHLSEKPEAPVANILVLLENQKNNFTYHKGFGHVGAKKETPVQKNSPFKIASITKMFTSVVILQLAEEGKIDLDAPIYEYLKDLDYLKFDELHLYQGDSFGKSITVRQLLGHRSGIADIFTDAETEFNRYVLENKQKQWNPEDLFAKYYEFGLNEKAFFEPGASFHYSDVGYFLLGLCIERMMNEPLAKQYRSRILQPLGMKDTYFEYYEERTNKLPLPHSYIGDLAITENFNTSFDWAGGGLVSTTSDLKLFTKALFENRLFANEKTLGAMIDDERYGYGVSIFQFGGNTYYGHLGFWGSGLFYSPDNEITICISLNQTAPPFNALKFVNKVVKEVEKT